MEFQDKPLNCSDCGQEFIFTAGEQQFYERKGFREIPKRCKACRDSRKNRRDSGSGSSTRPQQGDMDGNTSGRPQRELFEANCARCGMQAKVPFRPTAGRPVYCKECYAQRGE